ncbi:hypothetical protein ACE939_09460 [Aquimarina sp. W85]|uniref:hypothetical protein n=1 Tax=Aquimarina rhodophyticola TaxID=3342246 RepID=UPI00366EA091
MKHYTPLFLVCLYTSIVFGQTNDEILNDIKNQTEIIDSYTEFDILSLEPEEFLTEMVDHGPSFNGYYEHNRLKKMVKTIGTPNADVVTDYYFWNDELIFVSYKQRPYMKSGASSDALDYSSAYTKYEEQYFYKNGKQIDKKTIGKAVLPINKNSNVFSYSKKMKKLLDAKFINKNAYSAVQGKWVSILDRTEKIVFDGVLKINYKNDKYISRYKMKIEGDVISCWLSNNRSKHQFRIEQLTDSILTLAVLPSEELLFYDRLE